MKITSPVSAIQILIVDDHPMMLFGIKEFLSTRKSIHVVGTAVSGSEAIRLTKELKPDVVVMDISMPDDNGIETARTILHSNPTLKVIILSMHDEPEYVLQFVKTNAHGYVLKKNPPGELVRAIEAVHNGGAFFSPQVARILLDHSKKANAESNRHRSSLLTQREEEVLRLIARGFTSKEIAGKLCVSTRTVGKYRETLMHKLDIHSVAKLTQYAISEKLVEIQR